MLKRIAVIATAIALCTSVPVGAQVESYPPDYVVPYVERSRLQRRVHLARMVFGVLPGSTVTITAQLPGGVGATLPLQEIGSTTATGGSDFTAPFDMAISPRRVWHGDGCRHQVPPQSATRSRFKHSWSSCAARSCRRLDPTRFPSIRFGLVLTAAGAALAVSGGTSPPESDCPEISRIQPVCDRVPGTKRWCGANPRGGLSTTRARGPGRRPNRRRGCAAGRRRGAARTEGELSLPGVPRALVGVRAGYRRARQRRCTPCRHTRRPVPVRPPGWRRRHHRRR